VLYDIDELGQYSNRFKPGCLKLVLPDFCKEAAVQTQQVTLSRTELYERVWDTPIRTLATEFGISDVGLAKVCRRHQIPLPGLGYWARRQHGQNPPQTPLNEKADDQQKTITIHRSEPRTPRGLSPEEKEQGPKIQVGEDRPVLHPLARRIERNITKADLDERGMLRAKSVAVIPLKASPAARPRVLRLLDALFTATDQAGYKLEWPAPHNTQIQITALDEKLTFFVSEATNRKEHQPTPEERAKQKLNSWWRPERWDITPNGLLRFSLSSREFPNVSESWGDGKRRKLEDCLGEIFFACEKVAQTVKRERIERAEAERRRIEEQKRQAEAAARQAEYNRKAEVFKKLSKSWKDGRSIREFTLALRVALTDADVPSTLREELKKMIDWGLRHSDYLDPLTDLKWTADQFKKPSWMSGY
jgi:hypothetical protein